MRFVLPLSVLALAACVTTGTHLSPAAKRGLAFADANCAGCHAIAPYAAESPAPRAPTFEMVANRDGLTRETLTVFLRDAHNYPEAMNFTVDPKQIDDLVDYMLTLRRADYHPPI